MGITRLADITGLDVIGIPVVQAIRPNSRGLSVAQGKGLDLDAARASALMESIESYHAERIAHPLLLERLADLRLHERVIDITGLARLRGTELSPEKRMLWIEGTNLVDGDRAWVPFEVVHTDCTLPQPAGSGSLLTTSNGLASGNHMLEAITHAVCEVVERDAVALWRAGGRDRTTRLDLGTVDDEHCREVLQRLDAAGLDVAVWDATSDIDAPTFVARIFERSGRVWPPVCPMDGSGCHADRAVALLRALTEAAQARLTYVAGSRDDLTHAAYEHCRNPDTVARKRREMAGSGVRSFHDAPTFSGATFDDDVAWLLARIRAVGIEEVVVVDLTLPAFRIPVVRVVIPGLAFDEFPGIAPAERLRQRAAAAS